MGIGVEVNESAWEGFGGLRGWQIPPPHSKLPTGPRQAPPPPARTQRHQQDRTSARGCLSCPPRPLSRAWSEGSLFTHLCQACEWLWAPSAVLVPIATCGSGEEKNTAKQTLFKATTIRPPSWPGDRHFPAPGPVIPSGSPGPPAASSRGGSPSTFRRSWSCAAS